MATHTDQGRRAPRPQLSVTEEAYVRKLECMGLIPSGYRRYSDGPLTFAARPRWPKTSVKYLRPVAR